MGNAVKGYYLETTGEDYVVDNLNLKVPVFLDRSSYIMKRAADLNEGDKVLVRRNSSKKTLEDILPLLRENLIYNHSFTNTHVQNEDKKFISRFRVELLEGLISNGLLEESSENRKKILLENGFDFSNEEFRQILNQISGLVNLNDVNGVREQRIRTWLDGKSLGYKVKHSEDEEELIASLNRINPNFDDFRNLDDAQSWRYHIRVVRGVHSAINRYLRNSNSNLKIASQEKIEDDIDDLDDSSVSSPLSFISGTSSSAVNISALAEEIREQFMGDFDENYSFATITKMNPIKRNIKNYLKLEGLEGKLGDYGHLDFNLDGMEEKTYRDLFEQNLILRRYMIEITNLVIRSYFRDKNEDSIENVKGAFLNYLLSYNEGIEHFKSLPESEQRILKNLFENTIFNPKVDEFLNLEPGSVRKLAHLVFQGQSLFPYFVRRIIMKESLNDSPAMSTSDFISEDELRAFKKVMGFPFEYIDQNPQGFKLVGPQSNVELYNYFKERYGYSDDIIDRFSQRYPILFTTYYTRREVLDVLEPCGLENLIEFNPDYFILDKEYHADLIRKRNQYRKDKERKERRDSLAANYRANKSWLKNAEKGHRLLVNRIVEDPDLIEEGLEYVDVELGMEGAWARVDIIYRDVQGNDLLVEVKQNAYKNGGNFDNGMKAVEQVVGYRTAYEARRRLEHLRESKQFNGKKIRGMLVAHQIGDLEREVLGTMGCEYRIVPKI